MSTFFNQSIACLLSASFPALIRNSIGFPSPSTIAWSFVFNPPRVLPMEAYEKFFPIHHLSAIFWILHRHSAMVHSILAFLSTELPFLQSTAFHSIWCGYFLPVVLFCLFALLAACLWFFPIRNCWFHIVSFFYFIIFRFFVQVLFFKQGLDINQLHLL